MSKQPGLTVDQALQALAKGSTLIDIRTKQEYEAGHAPGARPVNPKDLEGDDAFSVIFEDDPLAELDAPIVVICDNGLRSGVVAIRLRAKGFVAMNIANGLLAWRLAGQPVIPGPYRKRS